MEDKAGVDRFLSDYGVLIFFVAAGVFGLCAWLASKYPLPPRSKQTRLQRELERAWTVVMATAGLTAVGVFLIGAVVDVIGDIPDPVERMQRRSGGGSVGPPANPAVVCALPANPDDYDFFLEEQCEAAILEGRAAAAEADAAGGG